MGTNTAEFKTWVEDILHDSTIKDLRITFTKTDGTERRMLCTLAEDIIPPDKIPKGAGRQVADSARRVFDLEKGEWRSFKWESLKGIEFTHRDYTTTWWA
jgi:hypothetical protein